MCVYRPKLVFERLQQALENWKQKQQAMLVSEQVREASESQEA
jgi:response regulator of citrate/malate metabolism